MIGAGTNECQTSEGRLGAALEGGRRAGDGRLGGRRDDRRGSPDAILPRSIAGLPCDGPQAGAILCGPSAPGCSRVFLRNRYREALNRVSSTRHRPRSRRPPQGEFLHDIAVTATPSIQP
jgi:hypothetical protein